MLEAPRAGAGRRPVAVAAHQRVGLVPGHPRSRADLDIPALVFGQALPMFADALARLRRTLWAARINAAPVAGGLPEQISNALIDILAEAA
jgi:hypothetical protein